MKDTIRALSELCYPDYEIIAVDDGSTRGGRDPRGASPRRSRGCGSCASPVNRGKAAALRAGIQLTDAEHVICVDGDALLDEALAWMVRPASIGRRSAG